MDNRIVILESIRRSLTALSSESVKLSGERFFREHVVLYGVRTGEVKTMAKSIEKQLIDFSKAEVLALCEDLLSSGMLEESFIACHLTEKLGNKYQESDYKMLEYFVFNYISNWATCDTFCNHTIGDFIQRYPKYINKLFDWAKSDNRWIKRAAAVSLIVPARKGLFIDEVFKISDILLVDKDDMVQKGYGWLLKSASKPYEHAVFDYVMKNKTIMPRTALRYAIEKMPKSLKEMAMRK